MLHVGSCDHYKNIAGVLRTLSAIRERRPDTLLVKAGEAFRAEHTAMIAALGLETAVRHLGRLDVMALVDAYLAADVLLFPSLYEGFGMPILEAMACGTAVVASRAGALPEVVGDAGLLFEPDDESGMARALTMLFDSEAERRCWGERGRARAKRFEWRRTARLTLECYRSVVQGER
jgi:glycosyltransferase involved in cell wall biosynthesis